MSKGTYDPTDRIRNWFIEVNENAECFEKVQSIVESMNGVKLYALIRHDKDTKLETSIDPQTGEAKEDWKVQKPHWHLCLELENGCTFSAIQKRLKGAHIEPMEARKSAYLYLTHESPNSKGIKYQYAFTDIISNNAEEVKRIITAVDAFEPFHEEDAMLYIAQGVRDYYHFYKRFGLTIANKFWRPYILLIQSCKEQKDAQEELENLTLDLRAEEEW